MAAIIYENKICPALPGETVLDTLLRHGVSISFSCKRGVCQACLLKCERGEVTEAAVYGLKASWQNQGYFLSCQCPATSALTVSPAEDRPTVFRYTVAGKTWLAPSIVQLILRPVSGAETMKCVAGQHLNLQIDNLSRTYSIANVSAEDHLLELHIKVLADGAFSQHLVTDVDVGSEVRVQGPMGNCSYSADIDNMDILCLGVGVGLAPLLGVIRDALRKGHERKISLLHGVRDQGGVYAVDELDALCRQHPNFTYQIAVLEAVTTEQAALQSTRAVTGDIYQLFASQLQEPSRTAVFLRGSASFVAKMQKQLFFRGVRRSAIFVDALQAS